MVNMSPEKVNMPTQDPKVRNKNFKEVSLGYSKEQAIKEAERCLNCKHKPCISGCPIGVNIPGFIGKIKEGDIEGAYKIIRETSSLPAVCGRVCPQEKQCEKKCVRGIKHESVGIGRLERFVADYCMEYEVDNKYISKKNGYKVAIVGSGPAGLTCAGDLAMKGYEVDIYEALHKPGGVLVYGIPEFRLPKKIVEKEIEGLKKLGVKIKTNMVIGKILEINELFNMGYEAVFIGSGAGLPNFMKIPGENLKGVFSANEFLTRFNLMKAYEHGVDTPIFNANKVAIIGGGNVAIDAARCAKRIGCKEVYIIYRRGMEELPARSEEVSHAIEEGIEFKFLTNPVSVIGDENDNCIGIECVEMELGDEDENGRKKPIVKKGSNFILNVDCMIVAIGTSPNPLILSTTEGLKSNNKGGLVVDENGKTTKEGVYAGGDVVTGSATVILAMEAGKVSAAAIDDYIKDKYK